MTDITIYHNPACGTSRNTLALIRNSGADHGYSVSGNAAVTVS
jgi:arsenate reductase-like glutaredoxin family protein